ncbi:hypothetical protein GWI33_003536 [Rhynchophorus ferrugineus]|uniref:Transposase n=1 Tax=Rhynchophorus ferrugineus TaxID=354439 RepID=A0A834M2Y4_RHYFE|nr:hypothetical protein GWI33_003536 [Rhynchophorus ferrugineus]
MAPSFHFEVQSTVIRVYDEPAPKRGKAQQSAALFDRLKNEIAEKGPHLKKKKVLYRQDNAPCYKSMKTTTKIYELGFELLPHPPYSPDLVPSDSCSPVLSSQKNARWEEIFMKR